MPLATTSPASAAVLAEGAPEERDNALLREEGSRMATSLVRFAVARRRRAPDATDLVVVDHIATDEAAYQLRGKLLAPATNTPVVLVAIKREPDSYPSYRELRAAFGLTRAEARVATMLAERKSNSEIAQELGVTGSTARRHTERLLLKLGVSRRAAVRGALLQCIGAGGTGRIRGVRSGEQGRPGGVHGRPPGARSACQAAVPPAADDADTSAIGPRRGRPKKRTLRRRKPKESIVVFLEHEHDQQMVRDALAGEVKVHFAEGPREVHPPWRNEAPTAVLVELHEEREHRMERALGILRREAPTIPRWACVDLDPASLYMSTRLSECGIITDVVAKGDGLGCRLRALLKNARVRSESEALRKVWNDWAGPETREILESCIAASATAATVHDVQHQLNKSLRMLRRELSGNGLPPLASILALCRLLRATYRLDHPGIRVKAVAKELGYRHPRALSRQFKQYTGLAIRALPRGRRFATLAMLVRAELSARQNRR
jgi:DNA-binding CsgD family transcriptional regulator/AraC-like DNA-binding protein